MGHSHADERQRHLTYLKKIGYYSKKKTVFSSERQSERVQALRQEFTESVAKIPPEDLVFIDESGLSVKMTRARARCFKGLRIKDHVPGRWDKNLTVVGALTQQGPTALMTLPGALDGIAFSGYVKDFLIPSLRAGNVVVMDNLSVHKVPGIADLIKSAGARLLYLPPYHPDLNPIEKMWSKLKALLRAAKARTMDCLEQALVGAISRVKVSDAMGWFKCCGY